MKKKYFVLMIMLLTMMLLTGCSASFKKQEADEETAVETEAEETKEDSEPEMGRAARSLEAEALASETDIKGVWRGTTYTNLWAGISIPFPEDAMVATEEQILALIDQAANNNGYSREQIEENLFIDCFVQLPDKVANFQVSIETNDYLPMENMADYYKNNMGDGYEVLGQEDVMLGGQMFTKVSTTVDLYNGIIGYQDFYMLEKGFYIAGLTVTYAPEEAADVEEILQGIQPAGSGSPAEAPDTTPAVSKGQGAGGATYRLSSMEGVSAVIGTPEGFLGDDDFSGEYTVLFDAVDPNGERNHDLGMTYSFSDLSDGTTAEESVNQNVYDLFFLHEELGGYSNQSIGNVETIRISEDLPEVQYLVFAYDMSGSSIKECYAWMEVSDACYLECVIDEWIGQGENWTMDDEAKVRTAFSDVRLEL